MLRVIQKCQTTSQPLISGIIYIYLQKEYVFIVPIALSKEKDETQNHRITESQNSRGWKGPVWDI